MEIHQYIYEPIRSNMFMMIQNNKALIIDPSIQESALTALFTREVEYADIFLTHEHYDHISGVNWLKQNLDCSVWCSRECAAAIEKPEKNLSQYYEILFLDKDEETRNQVRNQQVRPFSCSSDRIIEEETELVWEGHNLFFKFTPGHSKGSACIILDRKCLFSGDSLVEGNKTITRLPGGSRREFAEHTLPFLKGLSPEIIVYPGHGNVKKMMLYHLDDIV